ncbi:MAG: tRNA lysidine(34) synthetase TilS [Marmoricola sp.]|nr:tRNA lysidine(34) synthetase TilS [Marmoricola sp.]
MALDPALAAVRLAVRGSLGIVPGDGGGPWSPTVRTTPVLVACSGGADSLALLAAAIFEVGKLDGATVIGAVVDHGLQEGSAEHTAGVVEQMAALGADETASIRVTVDPGSGGIEAGAREARYAALSQLAEHFGSEHVLLGHTLDDQAETVLLGLARGSGGRSLQGMRPAFSHFLRPLLEITRAQTEAACRAEGIVWWDDPQNVDPRFLRAAVRHTVMPLLEQELGPGVAKALARTAEQLRNDMDEIERRADEALGRARIDGGIDLERIATEGPAILTRVLRLAAIEAGAIASELSYGHVRAIWRADIGKQVQLPGHVTAYRGDEVVFFRPTAATCW